MSDLYNGTVRMCDLHAYYDLGAALAQTLFHVCHHY